MKEWLDTFAVHCNKLSDIVLHKMISCVSMTEKTDTALKFQFNCKYMNFTIKIFQTTI